MVRYFTHVMSGGKWLWNLRVGVAAFALECNKNGDVFTSAESESGSCP